MLEHQYSQQSQPKLNSLSFSHPIHSLIINDWQVIYESYIFLMQSQTIDLSQILQVLSLHNKRSSTVSYQISDDLDSNSQYPKQQSDSDQITFELVNEESHPNTQQIFKNNLKGRDQCSHGKLPSMFQLFKQDPKQNGHHQSPHQSKIFTEKKKSSKQAIQDLKRKILDQRKNDEFCRKYTDLFDSIFFEKQEDKQKSEGDDEKQASMASTIHQLLSTQHSTEENPRSNTSISDSIAQPRITSNQAIPAPPKVVITYDPQNAYNNKTLCSSQHLLKNTNAKARISFTYGQPQQIDLKKSYCNDSVQCI